MKDEDIGIGGNLSQSKAFFAEVKKCRYFSLKPPRGGHYNDGFELLVNLEGVCSEEMLRLFDALDVPYHLSKPGPRGDHTYNRYTKPFQLEYRGSVYWLNVVNAYEFHGYKVAVYPWHERVRLNLNQRDHYSVCLYDVQCAQDLEKVLDGLPFMSRYRRGREA